MGIAYPQYFITPEQLAMINAIVEKVKKDNFEPKQLAKITHRPLRPIELNPDTTDAENYLTVLQASTAWSALCDDAAASAITIPTGSCFLIFGWICIVDPPGHLLAADTDKNPIGLYAKAQVTVNGVIKNEISLPLVNAAPNHCLLTMDQIVVATEQSQLIVQARGTEDGEALIFPLAYRIGPKNQLDVS